MTQDQIYQNIAQRTGGDIYLVVEPGTLDQARSLVFLMAERAVHHVADAVDEPRP